jgi:hypothetical protein
MSSAHDRIARDSLATGWGRIRRMLLGSPSGTAFDLDPSVVNLPLDWVRSGPIPGEQPCWCMPDDEDGPAKDGSFTDAAGAEWTIHNWQTGSMPIALVDRPAVLLGNRARLATDPTTAFDPGDDGLSTVLSFRWTRAGIAGSFLYSHRVGMANHSEPGWSSLATGFLCCGPAFGASDGVSPIFAQSPLEVDGATTSTVGVLDRTAGTIQAYTAGVPGAPVPVPPTAGEAPEPLPFIVGSDGVTYGGFEFFGAAVFDRPLRPDEVVTIDHYLAQADRRAEVTVPAPIRFA